jgi:hypothetical protein
MESLILPGPTDLQNNFTWSKFMVEVQLSIMAHQLDEIFKHFQPAGSPLWEIFWGRVEEMMVSNLAYNDGLFDSTYNRKLLQCWSALPLYNAWIYRSWKSLPSFLAMALASTVKESSQRCQGQTLPKKW